MMTVFKELKANVNSFKTMKERVAFLKSRSDVWDAIGMNMKDQCYILRLNKRNLLWLNVYLYVVPK